MVKLQNYKLVIANYCKLHITRLGLIHCKYVVWCFYGNKVSRLGQNNHYQLSVFNELLSTLADRDQKYVIFLQKHKRRCIVI